MKRERGQALLLVLALLGVGAVLIVPILQIASTSAKSRQMYGQTIKEDFAADAAVDYGMWRLKYESGFAASLPSGVESAPFFVTLNGIEASTTVMAQVQTGALSGQPLAGRAQDEVYKVTKTVIATSTYATFAADGYESGSGSGGTGTWLGSWTLSGDCQFSASSSYEGTYHLRLVGDDNSSPGDGRAQRRVNLSASTGLGPFLNFWAKVESLESGDTAQLKVSTNGSTWDVLKTFSSYDSNNQWRVYQYDLSSYGRQADFYVALETAFSSNHDYLNVDALSFSSSEAATTIQPGVVTDYTYYVTIECMDPNGGNDLNNRNLDRIIDKLPNRNATSGDFMQYIPGSTVWDQTEWGFPPFDPTDKTTVGSSGSSTRHQEIQWDFEDAGYEDVDFEYGQVRTMSFKARAALVEGAYGNRIDLSVRSGSDSDIAGGATAKFIVGNPSDTRLSGGLLEITKTADPLVLYPNEPNTITYTIDIKNVDTIAIPIYEVDDWLPSTGSTASNETFVYVPNSAHGLILSQNSTPDLFYDGFSRADSDTVSYWTDGDGGGSNVAIENQSVRMTTGLSYANQFLVESTSSIGSMNNNSRKTAMRFTAQSNKTVTKVRVYLEIENGTSPGYRYGLQQNSGGVPSGTWMGATNHGYGDFTATTAGWQTISLGESVSLTAGTVYHVVVQPTGSPAYPTGSNYIALRRSSPHNLMIPYDGASDLQSNTEFYSGSWSNQDYQPLYVLETATPSYEGNPYDSLSHQSIYGNNRAGERLTITGGTKLVTNVGFYVRKNSGTDPAADLSYEIRDNNNTVLRSGTLVTRTSITSSYQWYEVLLSSSVNMTNGSPYTIDLYSAGSNSSYYYQVLRNDKNASDAYNATTFDGTSSAYAFSTNGGTSWTNSGVSSDPYDIPFRLTYASEVSVTRSNISTIGCTAIVFSYEYWRGGSTGDNPQIRVEWKPSSSGTWNTLATHTPTSSTPTQQSWNLPASADNTNIDIRFTDLAVSNREARVDSVTVTSSVPIEYTPVGMPDTNQGADFFTATWQSNPGYRRWELNWDFGDYPGQDDPVWDPGGLCEGYFWHDYDPYLQLQPGQTLRVIFQAAVTLTASGSYYDEVFVRIPDQGGGRDWLYSWPTGEVSVPQYDLQAQTLNSILRANAMLTANGHWWRSWHWRRHK